MSKLRQHLESARSDYRAARYPGDLAGDVLARASGLRRARWSVAGAAVAAAALVMITVVLQNRNKPTQIGMPTPRVSETDVAVVEVPPAISFAELSSDEASLSFSPAAPDFSIGMPTITLVDDEQSPETSPTTQENV